VNDFVVRNEMMKQSNDAYHYELGGVQGKKQLESKSLVASDMGGFAEACRNTVNVMKGCEAKCGTHKLVLCRNYVELINRVNTEQWKKGGEVS